MCDAYRAQFGFDAFTVMPPNIYGVGDNFSPNNSHLVAGMMRRMHEATIHGDKEVIVWGSGRPQRELMFADDLGDACVHLMEHWNQGGLVNAGSSEEISVSELAKLIADTVGFRGELVFDATKPDGAPRKIMNNDRLHHSGFQPETKLKDGLRKMYTWYCTHKIDPQDRHEQEHV